MKKYLYVFNYPPEDKELCALEFRTLFYLKMNLRVNIIYQIKIIVLIKVFL